MCGIVGAVSARNIVSVLVEGLRGSNTAAMTRAASRCTRAAGCAARAAPRASPSSRPTSPPTHRERHRHRPHALGHPWRAGRAQRPPALLARPGARRAADGRRGVGAGGRRPDRARPQRHHREPRRAARRAAGARATRFVSQTDTEVIAHLVDHLNDGDLLEAVQRALPRLRGAYAIAVFCRDEPHRVVGARQGSPLVLGVGTAGSERELPRLRRDGARRRHRPDRLPRGRRRRRPAARQVLDQPRRREGRLHAASSAPVTTVVAHTGAAELGPYRHYMQKEIFEQPKAIADTLDAVARRLARAVRRRRLARLQGDRLGADPRLRHELLQRLGRQVLARVDRAGSRPASRSRASTATATACRTRARSSSRSRRAARPPTRWPRSSTRARSAWRTR